MITKTKIDASTAISKPYSELKDRIKESIELEELIKEHDHGHLPDIESLTWKGHEREVPDIVLVDIDHTLAHSTWRDKMIGNVPWDEYHRWGCHDRPVLELAKVINLIGEGFDVIGITGRPESFRAMTTKWLMDNGIWLDDLMMRADDDYRPNAQMKLEMAKERWGTPLCQKIAFVIDDNDEVISAFSGECVTTLQVGIRRYEEVQK